MATLPEGTNIIKVKAVDAVGNWTTVDGVKSHTIKVDTVAPAATNAAGTTFNAWSNADPGDSTAVIGYNAPQCEIGGKVVAPGSGSWLSSANDGDLSFSIWTVDSNLSGTAPKTDSSGLKAVASSAASPATVTLHNSSGAEIKVTRLTTPAKNGGEWGQLSSTNIGDLESDVPECSAASPNYIVVKGVKDKAGNVSGDSPQFPVLRDTSAQVYGTPNYQVSNDSTNWSAPSGLWINTNDFEIAWNVQDQYSGPEKIDISFWFNATKEGEATNANVVGLNVGGTAVQTITASTNTNGLANTTAIPDSLDISNAGISQLSFKYALEDVAGNRSTYSQNIVLKKDTAAPTVTSLSNNFLWVHYYTDINADPGSWWSNDDTPTVSFILEDPSSGVVPEDIKYAYCPDVGNSPAFLGNNGVEISPTKNGFNGKVVLYSLSGISGGSDIDTSGAVPSVYKEGTPDSGNYDTLVSGSTPVQRVKVEFTTPAYTTASGHSASDNLWANLWIGWRDAAGNADYRWGWIDIDSAADVPSIAAFTDSGQGTSINDGDWTQDTTPYFVLGAESTPATAISGFSIYTEDPNSTAGLVPDEDIEIYATNNSGSWDVATASGIYNDENNDAV